jgi:piezo-type mechanosensitive ion channel component 1/2
MVVCDALLFGSCCQSSLNPTPRLAKPVQDIYIARAEGELALEEELYWALINIYRLPSVMFELTKREKVE